MTIHRILPRSVLCMALVLPIAGAALRAQSPPPGRVDGSIFLELADETGEEVEISVGGAILHALSSAFAGKDDSAAATIASLESVDALIVTIRPEKLDTARGEMRRIESTLEKEGWKRLARARDRSSLVVVLVLERSEKIHGLVVMVFDSEEREMVFTNITGLIDLTALGELGDSLNLPGLDKIK